MENKLIQDTVIPCYDTDVMMSLRPSAFMNMAQEAANRHATELGFGFDDLQTTRTVWVLSRMEVRFIEHPKWRDKVQLQTWHKGAERLFWLRDFKLVDESGKAKVLATTSWLTLNIDTRRITRDNIDIDADGTCRDSAIETSCPKVQMPQNAFVEYVGTHTVSYSDVDMNGHANNAMYLVWAMDAVDRDTALIRPLESFRINFNHETKPGDDVLIYRSCEKREDKTIYYIEGKLANGEAGKELSAFCVELVF